MTFIDRIYRHIRPLRFLYGWAKDAQTRRACSRHAQVWRDRGFRGAKLDVCGGRNPFRPGEYLNVDLVPLPQVDLVFDITKRFPIPDGVIADIVSIATLEHLRRPHVDHVLREFFRILKPNGTLRISTPDIEAIAKAVLSSGDLEIINQHLFGKFKGEQTEDLDLHKWFYPAPALIEELHAIGFKQAEHIPMDIGMHDPEWNYLVRAWKPAS
ncbi:hypothetical protein COU80_05305 [Candidatus Peregrinibacteria bacterium CG10_big_fil_rev_8_21_14_0_10_55_24]|nr:MAG: hypothetical protein COU80_05305 [Candidatus Peregrinibacteria bacterium CG10_big_fil_rev_8_21_14_0_10_55_24]